MTQSKKQLAKRRGQMATREETLPVKMMPVSTVGRDGTATVFYMGVLGLLPTAAMGLVYGFFPLLPSIVLPFATFKACRLATTRHAAYEDVGPAHAAFIQSLLIWLCLLLSYPVAIAFDVAVTLIPQLTAGAFFAALGPGVAAQWADLPRQIYFPVQPSPEPPQSTQEKVIAGTRISSYESVLDKQLGYFANERKQSESQPTLDLTDEDYERF